MKTLTSMRAMVICGVMLLAMMPVVNAQQTVFYDEPGYTFKLAVELFEKEKYAAAKELFIKVIDEIPDRQSLTRADAEYYAGVSAFELKHPDAESRLTGFIASQPGHALVPSAWYCLGKLYYDRKSYKKATDAFNRVDPAILSQRQRDEYYFAAGYSWFETGNYSKAKQAFKNLKERDTKFRSYATYYYAHVCYLDGDYDEALKNFQSIKDHPDFKPLIPYYYAQILYQQKRYKEMPGMITPLIDRKTTKRLGTIARLMGDAYYKLNLYEEALGYMEIYLMEAGGSISRPDAYQIGYVYYKTGDFANARDMFQKAATGKDTLAQNAYYHLADCYIETKEKRFAMNAFLEAYKLGFDPKVTEDALFNYAKLSYELAINPYNQAIKAFEQFLGDYPNSVHTIDAQQMLVNLYLSTKNYKSALASIEKIKNQNEKMRAAYQKITWLRGVELFNDNSFSEAIDVFNKSLDFNIDKKTRALTLYWLGESWYRMESWENARDEFTKFQAAPGAFDMQEFNMANYNMGYTWFKVKDYDNALIAFRRFLMKKENERPDIVQDATLRAADCYFMKKDYQNATQYYKEAGEVKGKNNDYPVYHQAISFGAMGKFQQKAATLEEFIRNFPSSSYRDDALFELGGTYTVLDERTKALAAYNKLINEYPKGSYEKEALLIAGQTYHNSDNDDLALKYLDKVFKDYRGTPESKEALLLIRDIYTEMDKVDIFYEYVKGTSYAVSDLEKDTLAYRPAENYYLDGNNEKALPAFNNYIKQYPEGVYIIDATFYKAEIELLSKNYTDALEGYNFVTSQHRTKFTEVALLRAAEIHLKNDNCQGAVENYVRLEQNAENQHYMLQAQTGQLRCYLKLNDYPKAYLVASAIIRNKQHPDEIITEAYLALGKSCLSMDSMLAAQTYFETVLKKTRNEMGAEAKYNLALIQFEMQNYELAEKEIFELINDMSSYDYWIAKAFILLADVYTKTDNIFQAKHTLQSIIDNYNGEDLVTEAKQKLKTIADQEKIMEQKKAEEEIELDIKNPETKSPGL
jgi:TolA-binding protein